MTGAENAQLSIGLDPARRRVYMQALASMMNSTAWAAHFCKTYALLDAGDNLVLHQLTLGSTGRSVPLFANTSHAAFLHLSPKLIELPGQALVSEESMHANDLVRSLVELAGTSACVSWIVSERDFESLADHLRSQLNGVLLDSDRTPLGEVLLRFFDPRVLPGFMGMLSPPQLQTFLGTDTKWGTWLRSDRFQIWESSDDYQPMFPPRMQAFSIEQHNQLDAATRTDRIHARLRQIALREKDGADARAFYSNLFSLRHDLAFQHLDSILDRGLKHGFTTDSDLMLYAALALKIDLHIDHNEVVKLSIQRAVAEGCPLAHTLNDVPDEMWPSLVVQPVPVSFAHS